MSGRLGNYLELVQAAREKRLEITRSQEKELRGLYEEIARELESSLKRYSPKTLTYRWLKDYSKTLRRESETLHQTIEKKVSSSLLQTAGAVAEAEQKFYAKACPILSERFSHVFSSISAQVAEELMSGGIYRDFSGLSERIWQYEKQFSRDIQTIISRGILAQKPAYDLAKDLETYLRPEARKPWDWGKVYPGVSRQVDYSAQRLARTAVTHAYQLSLERATKDNPFVEGYRWHSSNGGRVCPLCRERDGKLYEKGSLHLDHPNGMCVVTAEISKSYEEIGRELGDWAAGRNQDPALDRWLNPEIFSTTREFQNPDGSFNLEKAMAAYQDFLTIVPEKNRLYLQQAFETVSYEPHKLPNSPFGYLEKHDTVYYDEGNPYFWDFELIPANTHELSHRIDAMFVASWENQAFSEAIQKAKTIIDTDSEKFTSFCRNDQEGFLSDICDAICESDFKFPAYHGKEYWAGTGSAGRKEKEIFANLFSLEAFGDQKKLDFFKTNFPEIWETFSEFLPDMI